MNSLSNKTLILVGKSGSGKTSLADELVRSFGFKKLVTYTTRPKRPGERTGKDYYFINEYDFSQLEKVGFFAETVHYNASFGYCSYGSSKRSYSKSGLNVIILNPYGLKSVLNSLDKDNLLTVYLDCSDSVIKSRLKLRGDDKNEIIRRLQTDDKDFKDIEKYVDYVINVDKRSIKALSFNIMDLL